MMGCRRKQCDTCWLHRQFIGVGVLALIMYWWALDAAIQETAILFAFAAVTFLLVVRHED
jgi:hypothetical protein